MTTLAMADRVRAEAAKLDPLKLLITLLTAPFWLIGFIVRLVWIIVSLVIGGLVVGWQAADRQVEARTPARGS